MPEDGYGVSEVDFCQLEPGITGAFYKEKALIDMFNTNDIYNSMARIYARDSLSKVDLDMNNEEFKAKHKDLRQRMKVLTLGIIYGMSTQGIAGNLDINLTEAKESLSKFEEIFPELKASIKKQYTLSKTEPYVSMVDGVRRYKGGLFRSKFKSRGLSFWEKRWFVNAPIQGSAAIVFKAAGNKICQMFKAYDARLLIPVHDSYVFEAPLENLPTVAKLVTDIMTNTLTEYFPVLRPRVDINISYPECWNKDGCLDFSVDSGGTLKEIYGRKI